MSHFFDDSRTFDNHVTGVADALPNRYERSHASTRLDYVISYRQWNTSEWIVPSFIAGRSVASRRLAVYRHTRQYTFWTDSACLDQGLDRASFIARKRSSLQSLRLVAEALLNLLYWWYSKTMLGRVVALSSLAALVLLLLLLQTTTPSSIGPVGLLAVFFLFYIVLIGIFTLVGYVGSQLVVRVSKLLTVRKPLQPVPLKRVYYFSSVLGLGPVMLLAMKSIGSLGMYEILLVGAFMAVAILYVSKREF